MGLLPHRKKTFLVKRRVSLSCGKAGVAEHLLDRSQVSAGSKKMRCEGMTKRMRSCVFGQTMQAAKVTEMSLHDARIEPLTVNSNKQRCVRPRCRMLTAPRIDSSVDGSKKRYEPLLTALATNQQWRPLIWDVAQIQ